MMAGSTTALRQRAPRLAEAAVERARLTVVPRARTRAARVPFVSLVTLLLLGGVVGLLLFNTSMQQSSFTATTLEQRAAMLSARQESLGMQLERLRDPQVIAQRAQRLGMRVPAAPLFLDLADGSVEGDAAGAKVLAPVLLEARPAARPSELDPPTTVVRPPEGELSSGAGGRASGRGDRTDGGGGGRNATSDPAGREEKNKPDEKKNKPDEKKNKPDEKKNKPDKKNKTDKKNRDRA